MNLYFTQIDPPAPAICALLAEKGWLVQHTPFRKVVFLDATLPQPLQGFDALVLTSKNAARWLVERAGRSTLPPLAIVGQTTAAVLIALKPKFLQEPAPNAKALAVSLRKVLPKNASVLYLCGAEVTGEIEAGLDGYDLTRREVYKTQKIPWINDAIDPESMVYFQAPSTVEDYRSNQGKRPRWVAAIGPSTAQTLRGIGWSVDFQPSRPESLYFANEVPALKSLGGTRPV